MPEQIPDYRSVLASVGRDGRRKWVEARIIWGRWRRWRAALAVPLIAFYCAAPFLQVAGHPMLRLDILGGKFYVGGILFWPQDLSYFVILALIGIVGTLLAVALLGRVFCGWFCPHDVFLEMVFRPLEHLLLGAAGQRERASRARMALMWLGFAVVSGGLANAGTAIFTGADAFHAYLLLDVPGHPYAAVFWAILFVIVLFNFGWFREQTCTIVCPYGRFQSAMLDSHTLTIAYDAKRGEPRGHLKPGSEPSAQALGDCVDCGLCVRVCPTAIDIRNGNQLECIHCAACVDACDSIMTKLQRPVGLIRYASEEQLAGRRRRVLRPRTVLYAVVGVLLTGLLYWRLATRSDIMVSPLQQTAVPVVDRDPDGRDCVRAVLPMALVNRLDHEVQARLVLDPALAARVIVPRPTELLPPNARITMSPIIYIPRDRFVGRHLEVVIEVRDTEDVLRGRTVVGVRSP